MEQSSKDFLHQQYFPVTSGFQLYSIFIFSVQFVVPDDSPKKFQSNKHIVCYCRIICHAVTWTDQTLTRTVILHAQHELWKHNWKSVCYVDLNIVSILARFYIHVLYRSLASLFYHNIKVQDSDSNTLYDLFQKLRFFNSNTK